MIEPHGGHVRHGLDTVGRVLPRNAMDTMTNTRKHIHAPLNNLNHRIFPFPMLTTTATNDETMGRGAGGGYNDWLIAYDRSITCFIRT